MSRAFTLVELIVVIGVLIVLTGIAIPVVGGYVDDANTNTCRLNMQSVVLAYRARTDALYGDINTEGALSGALAYGSYTVNSAGTYTAPCGGTCTVTYSDDHRSITNIACSLHGSLNSDANGLLHTRSDMTPNVMLSSALGNTLNGAAMPNSVDSGAVVNGPNTRAMQSYMVTHGWDFAAQNIRSWAIQQESGYQVVWFSDVDITKYNEGDWVRVIRYNPRLQTYTAGYKPVSVNTLTTTEVVNDKKVTVSSTYNIFPPSTNANVWKQYDGVTQTDATKRDYDKTLEIFNSMPLTIPAP